MLGKTGGRIATGLILALLLLLLCKAVLVSTSPRWEPAPRRAVGEVGVERIPVQTPYFTGSVRLAGARLDDLRLLSYPEALGSKRGAPIARPGEAFLAFGWVSPSGAEVVSADAPWRRVGGGDLSVGRPLHLTLRLPGLEIDRLIAVDEQAMFTVADTVRNVGASPLRLIPYGMVQQARPVGAVRAPLERAGAVGASKATSVRGDFARRKQHGVEGFKGQGGWAGVSERYWLSAIVPMQDQAVSVTYHHVAIAGDDLYQVRVAGAPMEIRPGAQAHWAANGFVGPQSVRLLQQYQRGVVAPHGAGLGVRGAGPIPRFDSAIDWGPFPFLARPMLHLLDLFSGLGLSFGSAIVLLTLVVKVCVAPLSIAAYASAARMKKLLPELQTIRDRFDNDRAQRAYETMALYRAHRVRPLLGLLPILAQIPIFYSLYKVLAAAVGMRQAEFLGWVPDLSQRDPTTLFNLFGFLPLDPAHAPLVGGLMGGVLHIGAWPVLYGLSVWLTNAMNPPAFDKAQRHLLVLVPLLLTIALAQMPVGLVIYWVVNNCVAILQQHLVLRHYGIQTPVSRILRRRGSVPVAVASGT
ncbi:membrane protein insertase YidC [Caulobacter sp. 1776]|uniref:membrane protein insertase YidC n=1 Tax=Caulobacter sp. 1776 TaxID=3156420 RepID=UPI003393F95F